VGITRARGQVYSRKGASIVPTFHPAAALRGGRFGGISTIDAMREDFQLVRNVLDERRAMKEAEAVASEGSEQLDLFG
jgi:uracil-DNA glycosylase